MKRSNDSVSTLEQKLCRLDGLFKERANAAEAVGAMLASSTIFGSEREHASWRETYERIGEELSELNRQRTQLVEAIRCSSDTVSKKRRFVDSNAETMVVETSTERFTEVDRSYELPGRVRTSIVWKRLFKKHEEITTVERIYVGNAAGSYAAALLEQLQKSNDDPDVVHYTTNLDAEVANDG